MAYSSTDDDDAERGAENPRAIIAGPTWDSQDDGDALDETAKENKAENSVKENKVKAKSVKSETVAKPESQNDVIDLDNVQSSVEICKHSCLYTLFPQNVFHTCFYK